MNELPPNIQNLLHGLSDRQKQILRFSLAMLITQIKHNAETTLGAFLEACELMGQQNNPLHGVNQDELKELLNLLKHASTQG